MPSPIYVSTKSLAQDSTRCCLSRCQASRNFDILCQDASSSSASEKGRLGSAPNVQSCSFPQLSAEKIEKGLNMTNSYDKRYDMNRYDMMITEFGSLHL